MRALVHFSSALAAADPAAAQAEIATRVTVEQAAERQRDAVRALVAAPACGSEEDDAILVCGRRFEPIRSTSGSGYTPPPRFAAPAEGPWFHLGLGPVTLSCCSISGDEGTGAGLSLRIRF